MKQLIIFRLVILALAAGPLFSLFATYNAWAQTESSVNQDDQSEQAQAAEKNKRLEAINSGEATEKMAYCHNYAEDAVLHHQQNLGFQCGFSGLRWNADESGQYAWCLTVPEKIPDAETNVRKDDLQRCFKTQTALDNPDNHPDIPAACQNPGKHGQAIQPVKQLYYSHRYETVPQQPVDNGLIQFDFNQDGQDDYIFMVVADEQATLAMCLSENKDYQRYHSDLSFPAQGDANDGSVYFVSQRDDLLVLDILFFGHNMGSSSSSTSYRYDKVQRAFTIVDDQSQTDPVVYDDQPYPMAAPERPELSLTLP